MYRPLAALIPALCLALAACYTKTPPRRPEIDLPELAEGEQIVVQNGFIERRDRYGVRLEIPVTEVEYNGARLTRGQLTGMSTPGWEAKGREYDAKRTRCKKYQAPRTIAGALATGSILFYYYGGSVIEDHRQRLYASLGGWAAGMLLYGFGYLVGGKVCNEATEMYVQYYDDAEERRFVLDQEIKRVHKLVRAYNLKHPTPAARNEPADASEE